MPLQQLLELPGSASRFAKHALRHPTRLPLLSYLWAQSVPCRKRVGVEQDSLFHLVVRAAWQEVITAVQPLATRDVKFHPAPTSVSAARRATKESETNGML